MNKMFSTTCTALTTMLILTGCNTANNTMQSNQTTSTDRSSAASNSIDKTNSSVKETSYTELQLATMTLKELGSVAQKKGKPLPFASKNVTRVPVKKSQVFFGSPEVTTKNGSKFKSNDFKVVDLWRGIIHGKSFELQIDKEKHGKKFIVDVLSDSKGVSMEIGKQPWITNFTGSYVIIASPNPAQGNPMYAINLMTASIVKNNSMNNEYIRESSGIGMGGYPSGIKGLPKAYNNFPNGQKGY